MSAHSGGPWVIRATSSGHGNNRVLIYPSAFVVDEKRTWDGGWYGRLGPTTKVFIRRSNAERWLRERPGVQGVVEEDPRAAIAKARGGA